MKHRKSVLSATIVTCLAMTMQVHAQETAPATQQPQADATELDTVTVVGIRGSMQRSLDTKRDAQSRVEVVTAEDIGKLPARNVADTLQRLPGVNISSSSANEGGFDENDRVSLRGTSPSLTQTLVNGHTIASADWFILSQVETVGRSVSYSLLPSELVGQVVVNKSSQAYLPEGGTMGSVNIITRKPLDFPDQLTADMSIGAVYSDLPDTTKPQFSGLLSWKNDDSTFGVMVQAFKQIRELRRDGQEIVGGFSQIGAGDPVATTNPDLIGVYYPSLPGAVYFTQTRERTGGLVEVQFKPNDDLTLGLSGFQSTMDAKNYNRNYMLWTGNFVPNQAPLPGYVVENNTLVKGDYAGVAGTGYGIYDMISRPESSSEAGYATFDIDWKGDNLDIKGQLGTTKGTGKTPTQNIAEVVSGRGQGGGWQVNGTGSPTDWYLNNPSGPTIDGFGTWGIQYYDVVDKEDWASADAHMLFSDSPLASLDFGIRYADHTREVNSPYGSDPGNIAAALDGTPVGHYPGDFGNGLGGSFPTDIWYFTQNALEEAVKNNSTVRKDGARHNYGSEFHIEEQNTAGYVQANFDGDRWDGNVGLRYVSIDQDIQYYQQLGPGATVTPDVSSLFGSFLVINDNNSHSKLLPSANFKYDITDDLLIRLAGSQTMTLADYSSLAGAVSLANLTNTGTAGNSDLKPTIGTNFDANLEWYFMPRGLLSFGVFSTDLKDYVRYDSADGEYLNDQTGQYEIYNVVKPVNADGRVRGAEVAYEQPIGEFFGFSANYTYADGQYDDGGDLVGTSENTWNASGFFENDRFNARVSYTYRSAFYHGMLRANQYYQDDTENLAASVGYKFNDNLSVSLDGLNLNNGTLKYYVASGRPQAFYNNGRQYYLTLRASF